MRCGDAGSEDGYAHVPTWDVFGGTRKDTDDGDEEKEFDGDREADTTPKRVSSGENEQHSLGVRTKTTGH